MSSAWGAYCDW